MSFSFTIFEKDVDQNLSTAVDDKIAQINDEQGRQEATALHTAIVEGIAGLSDGEEFGSAYVTCSIAQSAQLSISVSFKKPEQKAFEEEQAALRAQADAETIEREATEPATEA